MTWQNSGRDMLAMICGNIQENNKNNLLVDSILIDILDAILGKVFIHNMANMYKNHKTRASLLLKK
jgi:hypothetical protein